MKTLIINDNHLAPNRAAGTTKQSREALEDWQLKEFESLFLIPHDRVVVVGDLTDKRSIPEHVMKEVIRILRREDCTILMGNHDRGSGGDTRTLSSTEFIALMSDSRLISEPTADDELYLVPHMFDQEAFDRALQDCPDNKILLCHSNIDNFFVVGDHSLNMTLQQMKSLETRGVDIIAGHEHSQREYHNATIVGCQTPTSIADCLGGDKRCLVLEDSELTSHTTWVAEERYYEGSEIPVKHYDFINITGECELSEYPAIVKSVAELRKISDAFIVKNSVKVKEFEADSSVEEITRFNITEMLMEEIHPDFREEVKQCIK